MFYSKIKNPREFANSIVKLAKENNKPLVRQSENNFRPDTSAWYLINSKKEFYSKPKFLINWEDNKNFKNLTISAIIQKGLNEEISAVYTSKKGKQLIQNKNWVWQTFIKEIETPSFDDLLTELITNTDIQLTISGAYIDDPALFEKENSTLKQDTYTFKITTNLDCELVKAKRENMLLKKLNKVKSVSDLKVTLKEFSTDPWLWLTLTIETVVVTDQDQDTPMCDIYNNFFNKLY
jgi:hypothetical protein